MILYPYTTWGVEHEMVRVGMASVIRTSAIVALVLLAAAGGVVFGDVERHTRRAVAFAIPLAFLAGTAIARILWIDRVLA